MKHRRPLQLIALLLALTIVFGQTLAVGETIVPAGNDYGFAGTNGKYYTDFSSFEEEQLVAKDLAIEVASEGFVMLKNENDALPLEKGARISLFGMHSVDLVTSTVGSAAGTTGANGIEMSTLPMAMENAGFKVNPKLTGLYEMHHALGTADNELPLEYYSTATTSTYNGYNDAAIIVFSRTGSEGVDKRASNVDGHSDPMDHELMLDDNEKALVKHVKEYYPDTPIIVLINSSNIFQIPELAEDKAYDAVLACGPKPMLRSVARAAEELGVPCLVSMEERMGCGVGACLVCACDMADGSRKHVCKDGPVFDSREVNWDA